MRPQTQCLPAGEKVMDADRGAPGGAASLLAGQVARAAEEPEGVPAHQMTTKDLLGERVLSEKTCEQVRRWLADVVQDSHGTGKGARLERCTAAGKTGTAQVPSPYGGYLAGTYTASFCGFFPAEAPQMVVLVVLGRPKGQYYGGQVAAPVFKAVCDRISYLDQVVLGGSGNAA
jgi:stage V sporulation protein D (sporulation-specific penicillin-binding protein)